MWSVSVGELSRNTRHCLAQVRAGKDLEVTEHGKAIAVVRPAHEQEPPRIRPRIGGYRSERPLTAEEIDAELAHGLGER
ncbi:type II toxin-antitoxin system prevent-host-death family antitoxin [Saccharomonospora iraqiensis]|uniref:type II toxin-antitoxin system prevent-host-death family antitoxin n=1 Tax=Saccharomonospora iraqiensis TaxID=52698 RepID=UPI0003F89D83|nr:type II toxin-antitoxin system prevent-host-death family antitoxin [Saccharomonospora iraqiensis]